MGQMWEGSVVGQGLRVGIVAARFNEFITKELLSGAIGTLRRYGVAEEAIDVARVPGSLELPVIAKRLAASGKYDVILCLGTVIRGSTPHFEYVAAQSAAGITRAALDTDVPVIFGVITTDTIEQAIDRAGVKEGNKGAEAAVAAIEMATLGQEINAALGSSAPTALVRAEAS